MTTPIVPDICFDCIHDLRFKRGLKIPICDAFPDGIPDPILFGKNKHKRPLPGQKNNLVYELDPDAYVS